MFVEELTQDELEAELVTQAAHVDAGLCRLLELVAECGRRLDWASDGATFATWLAWRCSLLPRQAREQELVAARLAELPLIHAAFARGELSYGKVTVLAGVAAPESERELLELAEVMTASQLQRAVAAFRRVTTAAAGEQQAREFVSWFWEEDGSLALRARLAADEGALVLHALETARKALRERRRAEADRSPPADRSPRADQSPSPDAADPDARPPECRVTNAEALAAMADLALANADADRSGADRYQLVVHVDVQTLASDGDGRCDAADGVPLAAETARRFACDASIVEVVEREGEPLALGRKRRTVSPALRRALKARDRGCRFPGCESTRFVEAHHIEHWAVGGATDLTNLILLCRRHHRLVHERGYTLGLGGDGEPHFVNQYGIAVPSVPRSPPPSDRDGLREQQRELAIDATTCRNGTGDRMHLALAADAIAAAATAPAAA
jgi:hypothetical protein